MKSIDIIPLGFPAGEDVQPFLTLYVSAQSLWSCRPGKKAVVGGLAGRETDHGAAKGPCQHKQASQDRGPYLTEPLKPTEAFRLGYF